MLKAWSIVGLGVAFAIAYGCDRWVESLRTEAAQTLTIASFLWGAGVAHLLLAGVLLLLAWYVIVRADRSKLASSVFALVGLLVTFASAITISAVSTLPPLGIVEFLTPNSYVLNAAAFVAVIGFAGFVLPKLTAAV